jgi:hypothetical protein
MKTLRRWVWLHVAGLGVVLSLVGGCQTQVLETTQTLPTGWYLKHLPQYIPPTPEYPLPRETANLVTAVATQPTPAAPPSLLPGAPGGP